MHVTRATTSPPSTTLAAVVAVVVSSLCLVSLVSAQGSSSKFPTLNGNPAAVVARGGFSGLFPDSSSVAFQAALLTSVPDLILWCDVQLTKDQVGICAPQVTLENSTDIARIYENRSSSYSLNGVTTKGWFSVNFTSTELQPVSLTQGVFSRTNKLNGNFYPLQTVDDVASLKPPGLWLNIQHDAFFSQHKLSMRSYVLSVIRRVTVSHISSPEASFLQSINSRLPKTTKPIFRFLGPDDIEPSTNQSYGSLLGNLTTIKTFASGILVPKSYIWPVDSTLYLQSHTSLVLDAHKAGLEVYASDFYNDVPFSYNYSYDPVTEYLYFTDNGDFSVDGVLSDFPVTASEALDCFTDMEKNASEKVKLLVISKNGASGDYPGCTNLAYENAITDGADVIDCSVQMSKDSVPFCLSSVNLIDSTNVAQTKFSNLATTIPELMSGSGIFTFSMNWADIQSLTPAISNPEAKAYQLFRNPKFKSAGKLISLSEFLDLAKNASSLSGVLIDIENAAYLIEMQKLPVVDTVLDVLGKAGFKNQTSLKVMVQSSNSSVLMKLKGRANYELVYEVDENIRDADASAIADIKKFADSVVISKESVFPVNRLFVTGVTDVVSKLQSSKLPVYVGTFSNEFVTQPWDFFSDPTAEINAHVMGAEINGVITDFPKTAARYKKNRCLNLGNNTPAYMTPANPGSLLSLIQPGYLPPAEAPNPVLDRSDVVESPLPSVTTQAPTPGAPKGNGQPKFASCIFLSHLVMLFSTLLLL